MFNSSFHPEVQDQGTYTPERVMITQDEDGCPCYPYGFTRICGWRWEKNKPVSNGNGTYRRSRGFTRVVNNLPFGFAEAVDLPQQEE